MAPVIAELRRHPDEIRSIVCSAGQHRQMLDQVLDLFKIVPDVDLHVMTKDQTLSQLTANLFVALDSVITDVRPDWILAQGDTTTVLVAAMEAHYHRVRFGHVEAGLRTRDKHSPFPEEMNRRIADVLADAYFAPTPVAARALLDEGCAEEDVYITGNTVIDALYDVVDPTTGRLAPCRASRANIQSCWSPRTDAKASATRFASCAWRSGIWPSSFHTCSSFIRSI